MNILIITQKVDKNDQLLGFFIDWLRLFAEKFEKVTVLCLEKGEFNLPQNVKVISLGKERGAGKLGQLFNFYFSIFSLRSEYDAVFVHMNPIWVVLGGWAWRLLNKKVFFWYTSGGVTTKLRLAEKFADVIFTASKESFRLPSKKVIVTGHGIDTELFKPNPSSFSLRLNLKKDQRFNLKILSVGRIAPVKNYEILVDAAKILKDEGVSFVITMVGEAPLNRDKYYVLSIKDKIKELGLENNFNFVGKVNHKDLSQYYQENDIFVHLSKTGSLDKTILEAMACEMNILSSNDSSRSILPKELIFNENDPIELAEKIQLVSQKPHSQELRNYVVENHNLNKLINKISEIIKS